MRKRNGILEDVDENQEVYFIDMITGVKLYFKGFDQNNVLLQKASITKNDRERALRKRIDLPKRVDYQRRYRSIRSIANSMPEFGNYAKRAIILSKEGKEEYQTLIF